MQEHKLCVLVLTDVTIRTRKAKIVVSDKFPRLNYYQNAFVARAVLNPDPVGSLITSAR